jgi:hypothetical protein
MMDVKTEDGIATVTMRHGKANALDITLCEGLADCFDKLCASDARAVVLTGQGHIFSAGVDLLQVSAGGADAQLALLERRAGAAPDVLCGKFGYSPRDSVDPRFTNPSFGGLHSPIRRARCTSVIVMFFAPITIAIRPVNALVDSSYTA